jgi:HAD superfamily hydrolase (TIGR01509 family)
MEFDLVIFDCDGVLIDSELLACRILAECLAESGVAISTDEVMERYMGISWAGMLADMEQRGVTLPFDLDERYRRRYWPAFEADLKPISGITAVLDGLRCNSCVASSGRPDRLKFALSLVGLYERFHPNVFSAAEVKRGKPAPDLFLHAAQRMGVAPADCLVVEDSLPGIAAARAAGMTALGFAGGSHCRPDHAARLSKAGAALVIAEMAEFFPAISGLARHRTERPDAAGS